MIILLDWQQQTLYRHWNRLGLKVPCTNCFRKLALRLRDCSINYLVWIIAYRALAELCHIDELDFSSIYTEIESEIIIHNKRTHELTVSLPTQTILGFPSISILITYSNSSKGGFHSGTKMPNLTSRRTVDLV